MAASSNSASTEQVCKFFASSSGEGCKHGAMCKFSHDLNAKAEVTGVVPTPHPQEEGDNQHRDMASEGKSSSSSATYRRHCRFFKRGHCKDGSNCRYSHAEKVAPQDKESNGEPKQKVAPKYKESNGEPKQKVAPKYEESNGEPKQNATRELRQRKRNICKYFVSAGGCKVGDQCRYLHEKKNENVQEGPNESPENENDAGNENEDLAIPKEEGKENRAADKKRKGKSTYPCNYFNSSRGCRLGDRCRYLHDNKYEIVEEGAHGPQENQNEGGNDNEEEITREDDKENKAADMKRKVKSSYPCKYFNSSRGCRLGDRCRYLHDNEYEIVEEGAHGPQENQNEVGNENEDLAIPKENDKENKAADMKRKGKSSYPCKYFNSPRGCRLGDNCRYLHEKKDGVLEEAPVTDDNTDNKPKAANAQRQRKRPQKPKKTMGYLETDVTEMTQSDQEELRENEVSTLKKKYKSKEVQREKSGTAHQITVTPSDPDWPYAIQSLTLNVYFPTQYPKKMMEVTLPEQENLPETVRRCIYFSIIDWVAARHRSFESKNRVERVFRPFTRWLDSDLEDIFTDALTYYKRELDAKAAGIEIIPARHLQARFQQQDDSSSEEESTEEESDDSSEEEDDDQFYYESDPYEYDDDIPDKNKGAKFDSAAKGTEIKLRDLHLGEFVGTLSADSVKIMVRCNRCREAGEISTPPERLNQLICGKCSHTQLIKYRPALMHGNSAVMGHLDLEECTPADLLLMDCDFVANCMRCNRDNKLGGIPPGQPATKYCKSCHAKFVISIEGVQFRNLQPTVIGEGEAAFQVTGAKLPRNIRDPRIKLGQPLPDTGTCKHFKKSFRWLRFPCCGKTYPCDICHDEKEDHEYKFANRMVCGYCSREQAFSAERPCTGCGKSMTGRSTAHWEGGKGCRDVIKMSRNEDRKYTAANKTVSRKSQSKTQPKKNTVKVRHS